MAFDAIKLATAIQKAALAAKAHINEPDGGTCNFDYAYIRVKGMRPSKAHEIATLSGVELRLHDFHGRVLELCVTSGQGARRTAMAEAAHKSLKESGIDAGMYYRMD